MKQEHNILSAMIALVFALMSPAAIIVAIGSLLFWNIPLFLTSLAMLAISLAMNWSMRQLFKTPHNHAV